MWDLVPGESAGVLEAPQDLGLPPLYDVEPIRPIRACGKHHQKALVVQREVVIRTSGLALVKWDFEQLSRRSSSERLTQCNGDGHESGTVVIKELASAP